uniref:hypothetical protein n=1 Tax=uncultured Neptuniibacter sp. TaxID=502143 RepID=UPI0032B2F4AC
MVISLIKKILKIPYIRSLNFILSRRENKKYDLIDILDNKYKVIKGTWPGKPDYDDAWLLLLSQRAKIVFDIGIFISVLCNNILIKPFLYLIIACTYDWGCIIIRYLLISKSKSFEASINSK